jgi:N-acetylmuramoyl-L-alanine amidase
MEFKILSKFSSVFIKFLQRFTRRSRRIRRLDLYDPGETDLISLGYTSPNYSDRHSECDTILLHHTGGTHPGCTIWLCDKDSGVSAHYVITRKGIIYSLVPVEKKAWHAGRGAFDLNEDGTISASERDWNSRSIGIEIESYEAVDYEYPGPQLVALDALVLYLVRTKSIKNILGHKEIAPDRKIDPANFDMDFYRTRFKQWIKELQIIT